VHIRDATLTDIGRSQCRTLQDEFQYHLSVDLIVASPMRRTIQTAALSFGPTLARPEVPFLLTPLAQEAGDWNCDIGHAPDELEKLIPDLLPKGLDFGRLNLEAVQKGWNSKVGNA
jgi:broad specificity phosphatase PhoE